MSRMHVELDRDHPRRTSQMRKAVIRSLYLDLPSDLAGAISLVAIKTGIEPSALIIDILRDVFGHTVESAGGIASRKADAAAGSVRPANSTLASANSS
jgi:hypothetical protein